MEPDGADGRELHGRLHKTSGPIAARALANSAHGAPVRERAAIGITVAWSIAPSPVTGEPGATSARVSACYSRCAATRFSSRAAVALEAAAHDPSWTPSRQTRRSPAVGSHLAVMRTRAGRDHGQATAAQGVAGTGDRGALGGKQRAHRRGAEGRRDGHRRHDSAVPLSSTAAILPSSCPIVTPHRHPGQHRTRAAHAAATARANRPPLRPRPPAAPRLAAARIDHRSLRDQGIDLKPQHKIGPAGARREERGEAAERAAEHREIARRNGDALLAEPAIALRALTRQHSTFTRQDLARFVDRHSDGAAQFASVLAKVEAAPELVRVGADERGRERFTTREMLQTERRMEQAAAVLAERERHGITEGSARQGQAEAARRGLELGAEQVDALEVVTNRADLALVVGYAGTGKSAMLGVARTAWEAEGYRVRGLALSGIAAEGLEAGSGIASRTIASLEHGWAQGRDELTRRDVLVVDEAGMIGSRQMERLLSAAQGAGAKVVLIGDPEQLQAIEAGAAFRALAERHGAAEITEVRRQRED
jgi:hypothetical protein